MIIDYTKITLILLISLLVYYLNLRIINTNSKKIYFHQKYSSDYLGNPIGGYVIFLFILFFNFYFDLIELFFLFLIFVSGILSDNKLFNSPIKRLFFQSLFVIMFVIVSNLEIISTRNVFLDQLLSIVFINVIFTSFCILIVINGSNFIDGLNGVVISYYSIIVFILLSSDLNLGFYIKNQLFENLFLILIFLLILNYLNIIFLGDNGSYLIGFLFSIFLIRLHQNNGDLSPYFIILLLWYPCFENLFSIIRKKLFKISAVDPDNQHLHHLIFNFISKIFKIKNKLIVNNLSSLIISFYHLPVFIIGFQNYTKTNVQLSLIFFNLVIYVLIYVLLLKLKKKKIKKSLW